MKGNASLLLMFCLILTSCSKQQHEVLIEAESFKDKGGWVVDPQFVEQMGSPYLLSHGMGVPVENVMCGSGQRIGPKGIGKLRADSGWL
jgi:hypothetical protein